MSVAFNLFNKDYSIDKIYFNKGVYNNIFTNTLSNVIMRRYTMVSSPRFDDIEFRYKIPGDLYSVVIKNFKDDRASDFIHSTFRSYNKVIIPVLYKQFISYLKSRV